MISVGYALRAAFGTGIYADGLACLPTVPASMQVTVGQGSIITTATVDASAYGTIAADNANALVKMGINPFGSTSFTLTAPGTSGQSINYLIEAQLVEADGQPVALPYYNASSPSQPFTGPNNNQAQQNTVRTQRVGLQLKAGSPAAAGTQQTPGVDAGWVGLYIITVNFAQTTVTSLAIAVYPGAPFITSKIPALAPLISPGFSGTPTAPTPPPGDNTQRLATTAFVTFFGLTWAPINTPAFTGIPTAPTPPLGDNSQRLATTAFTTSASKLPQFTSYTSNSTFIVPAGVTRVKVTAGGGGGGGGGITGLAGGQMCASPGGNGGSVGCGVYTVTPGQSITVTIGTGGAGGTSSAAGSLGGTSSFGSFLSAPGGNGAGTNTLAATAPFTFAPSPCTHFPTGYNLYATTESSGMAPVGTTTVNVFGGAGGPGIFGGAGGSAAVGSATNTNGVAAIGWGSGGGGAAAGVSTAGQTGGAGMSGLVLVEW